MTDALAKCPSDDQRSPLSGGRVSGSQPRVREGGGLPTQAWAAIVRGLNPHPAERFPDLAVRLLVLRFPEVPGRSARPRARAKLPAVVSAVLLGAGAVAYTRGGGAAAAPPAPTAASAQAAAVTADAGLFDMGSLYLRVGGEGSVSLREVVRFAVADREVVGVRILPDALLRLEGLRAGETSLVLWLRGGHQLTWRIMVRDLPPADQAAPPDASIVQADAAARPASAAPLAAPLLEELDPESNTWFVAPGAQKVARISGMTRIGFGDPEVAGLQVVDGDRLRVSGVGVGRTTVRVWTSSGPPTTHLVVVSTHRPRIELPLDSASAQLALELGAQEVLLVPNVTRALTGDTDVAEAGVIAAGKVLLVATGEGDTTLLIFTSLAQPARHLIHVRKP